MGILMLGVIGGCDSTPQEEETANTAISSDMFEHHYITTDMPTDNNWGYGTPASADFDKDGDQDFAFGVRADSIYWFEFDSAEQWTRHAVGPALGAGEDQHVVHRLGAQHVQ